MAEILRAAVLPALDLDRLLLDTKLAIPLPRAGFVSRSDIFTPARESDRRVVAVTAPAGYGKSSLLAQWAAIETRPVIWVSLDERDDDPVVLLALLASAFARATGADPNLVGDMRGHGAGVLGRAAPRLASVFSSSDEPFVVMLDDVHELRSPASEDALSVIIAGVPEGSQFVTASRFEQAHVRRLRASGDALELGVAELTLNAADAQHIFAEADVTITHDQAATAVARTEGWPAGLHLAAVIAHDSADPSATITGDDRYVADYLYSESLAAISPEIQAFLRRTAILDRFSAPLCDSLLGQSSSQNLLQELEASNVFLVPLDRRRQWYRYHSLFREFLLGELHRIEPEAIAELRLRAADWYEANGAPGLAVEHLLHTPERERCVRLITELILPVYQAGEMTTAKRWLTAIGDAAIIRSPSLAVLAGWIAATSGEAVEAERWMARLDTLSDESGPADGSASFASGRAMLRSAMCLVGPAQVLADIELALSEEPSWSVWRDQALGLAGEAYLLVGATDTADRYFAESAALAGKLGNQDIVVRSNAERALIAMDRDHWVEAAGLVDAAVVAVDEHRLDDYAASVLAFAGAARLAVHRGHVRAAKRELIRAMRARPVCTYALPGLAVRVRLSLARTCNALNDQTTARHLLRECEDILLRRPALGVLVDETRQVTDLIDSRATGEPGRPPLTPAELRLLPFLQTHLTIPEIGTRLFVSRNTVSTEVGSIYRKLGVSSRAAAVERATAIGLLGG